MDEVVIDYDPSVNDYCIRYYQLLKAKEFVEEDKIKVPNNVKLKLIDNINSELSRYEKASILIFEESNE